MKKKIVKKAVSLNQSIIEDITLFQYENKCADFSEALRLIISSHFKRINDEKNEKKLNDDIGIIKDSIRSIANYLKAQNEKKQSK